MSPRIPDAVPSEDCAVPTREGTLAETTDTLTRVINGGGIRSR